MNIINVCLSEPNCRRKYHGWLLAVYGSVFLGELFYHLGEVASCEDVGLDRLYDLV